MASAVSADTKFGASTPEGVSHSDSKYGHLDAIRVYNTGAPAPWDNSKYGPTGRPVIVSFKYPAQEVISGKHDKEFKAWLNGAPKNRTIWWSYWHEPENDFETAAETSLYRAAWRHLSTIANTVDNPNLKATVILMSWKFRTGKGEFNQYYAGDKYIDVVAWDGYSRASLGEYFSPQYLFGAAFAAAKSHHKPIGIAEWGSDIVGKDYQGRAKWIRDTGRYFSNQGAKFATYWDAKGPAGGICDCRLNDKPSIDAFKSLLR